MGELFGKKQMQLVDKVVNIKRLLLFSLQMCFAAAAADDDDDDHVEVENETMDDTTEVANDDVQMSEEEKPKVIKLNQHLKWFRLLFTDQPIILLTTVCFTDFFA